LQQRIQKRNATLITVQLLGLFDAAEFAPGGVARVLWTQASANVFLG